MTRIDDAIQRVVRAIAPISPNQMLEPRLAGGRSVKDVLAHLAWWDQWLLFTLPPSPNTPQPPLPPPLFAQIPSTNDWAEEMNAKVTAYHRSRDLAPIHAEFMATYPRLRQRVAQLSSQDLHDPAGMSAVIGQPVAPLVLGIYEHYEEHAHELEQLCWEEK